jgi:peptidyl-prolyl cis-trans isomerase A (cyclophilin A)
LKHKLRLSILAAVSIAATLPAWAQQKVRLTTTLGDIVVELDAEKAPKTTANFVAYVKAKHYDGLIFHRVISTFMVQGGGYTPELSERPTRAPIALESRTGLSNLRGTVSMARTSVPNSATSQFFINVGDNLRLDQPNAADGEGYAVFGKVIEGMDVVDKIRDLPTVPQGMHQNLPATPVVIKKASLEK